MEPLTLCAVCGAAHRRMLKWTYAYGYYTFEVEDTEALKQQRLFFEFLQVRCGRGAFIPHAQVWARNRDGRPAKDRGVSTHTRFPAQSRHPSHVVLCLCIKLSGQRGGGPAGAAAQWEWAHPTALEAIPLSSRSSRSHTDDVCHLPGQCKGRLLQLLHGKTSSAHLLPQTAPSKTRATPAQNQT